MPTADEGASIRIPVHRTEKITKLDRALDRMDVRVGGSVSDLELAEELEWAIDEVRQFRGIPREAEYPASIDDWDNLLPEPSQADVFDRAETERIVTDALAELPKRQADVIRMRFGIGCDSEMTLEEIGQLYGVTRERIRQIEAKALQFLSHPGRSRRLQILLGYEGGRLLVSSTLIEHKENNSVEGAKENQPLTPNSDDQVDRVMRLWSAGMSADEITQKLGGSSWKSVIGMRDVDGC